MLHGLETISRGSAVLAGRDVYEVYDFIDLENVTLIAPDGKQISWPIRDLQPLHNRAPTRRRELEEDKDGRWKRAFEKYQFISGLVKLPKEQRTLEAVEGIATICEVHVATVYRWIEKYGSTGSVSGLMRAPRADMGEGRLEPELEAFVAKRIRDLYLTENRKSMASVAKEIQEDCRKKKFHVPNASTIRARMYALDPEEVERARYGKKLASEKFSPLMGSIPNAGFPLAIVQIDHTPMDIIVVDDIWRKSINRPYLTVALDVKTKMVLGFYISLDPPGALATGQCLSHAILDKKEWLEEKGLGDLEWPCRGKMRTVHSDNANEFKGTMLARACKEHGINPERRPKGAPRYGGHIERGFRTWMRKIHDELAGTTFSSIADRLNYDSEGKAVMSLSALEKWFTMYLLGYYHIDNHDGNDGIPPLVEWKRAYIEGTADTPPIGIPFRVANEEQLRLDFLPFTLRTVQEYGIRFEGMDWYSDSIRRFIHATNEDEPSKKKLFVCRYDPRNMSILYFWDDKAEIYIEVPFRNRTRPPVSLWEIQQAKKKLSADAQSSSNEELIFRTVSRMRALAESEAEMTKSARRAQQRRAEHAKVQKKDASRTKVNKVVPPSKVAKPSPEDDLPIAPFAGIREA